VIDYHILVDTGFLVEMYDIDIDVPIPPPVPCLPHTLLYTDTLI